MSAVDDAIERVEQWGYGKYAGPGPEADAAILAAEVRRLRSGLARVLGGVVANLADEQMSDGTYLLEHVLATNPDLRQRLDTSLRVTWTPRRRPGPDLGDDPDGDNS